MFDSAGNRCSTDSPENIVYNGRCYIKYENENLTWYNARERCINNGGDLAQFQNSPDIYSSPFNTSWLNTALTYWVGIRWNGRSWNSSGILSLSQMLSHRCRCILAVAMYIVQCTPTHIRLYVSMYLCVYDCASINLIIM